jgi:hypothetical protein
MNLLTKQIFTPFNLKLRYIFNIGEEYALKMNRVINYNRYQLSELFYSCIENVANKHKKKKSVLSLRYNRLSRVISRI